jgi:hypothetical protein
MVQYTLHHLEYEAFSWASSSFHSQSTSNTYNTGLERVFFKKRKEKRTAAVIPGIVYRNRQILHIDEIATPWEAYQNN